MAFKPSSTDLDWARMVLSTLAHNGVVAMPDSGLIYQVDHENRSLVLMNPSVLVDFDTAVVHAKTIVTFGVLGYAIKQMPNPGPSEIPDEIKKASEALAEHLTTCEKCSEHSQFLCLVAVEMLRNYHYAVYLWIMGPNNGPTM